MQHPNNYMQHIQDPSGKIPLGEPVFLLRAQDKLAPETLLAWCSLANAAGVPADMVNQIIEHQEKMVAWQKEHGSKVPDMPEGGGEALTFSELKELAPAPAPSAILDGPVTAPQETTIVGRPPKYWILIGIVSGLKNGNNYSAITMKEDETTIYFEEDRGPKGVFRSEHFVTGNLLQLENSAITDLFLGAFRKKKEWTAVPEVKAPPAEPVAPTTLPASPEENTNKVNDGDKAPDA